ncbi:MAG: dihydroorotate dehydrogenase electron transfer subunit [Chloroflexi bacterium]|nr:dihydroorotate dehydrogenase electron transfer subunit [Chloroflexota bacterium]
MDLVRATVMANDEIMPGTHALELESTALAAGAAPGQFVHVRCTQGWDPLLRRPISIFRIRPTGVSLMVRALGPGSSIIAQSAVGTEIDCLGPLGRPFTIVPGARRLVMLGGGYGVAPLVGLAEQALKQGCEVVLLVGAATAPFVFPADLLPPEVEYAVATMDGSLGHRGYVTELLPKYLDWSDAVYACGPTPMLEAIARQTRPARFGVAGAMRSDKPVQLALEQHMGCAMGVCLGCVVPTRRGYQRVCRDGPVFGADDLIWDRIS